MSDSRLRKLVLSAVVFASVHAYGDYEDGVDAAQNGDFATALAEFTAAAEQGLDLAQYNLAILYFTGQGVEQDYDEAFKWTKAAAEQGHTNAQFNLGALYYTGSGTSVDLEAALQWYGIAAQAQHAVAQYNLATMYETGEGTDLDLVQAYFWANASQYNEYAEATILLQALAAKMTEAQITAARGEFARWLLAQ